MTWEAFLALRVKFVQSGGIVGGVSGCELESASLAPEDARELETLVRASGLLKSGEFLSTAGRDLRSYEIEVAGDSATVSVRFDDATLPEQARPLVSFLRRNSKPRAAGR
jgi:hypothetical protein